ncbi:hypothetical protein DFA_02688 [Cavenderia fasciculata]|uniref:Uncharacterized protein n=1 Tax=Cavenderia fasciculata TaxID=261658 RepID=F4Q034_CACFS|nr:uncharacterized protein DFA_02688 [Cavenderia fasciculata]EGG18948.1 hypothetical protein DFA_02688 [Cavenderia fasciculata]|eukprot:XP_004357410.1 hypothetical protein DFA_02688 [Cavenderia fasciculata]
MDTVQVLNVISIMVLRKLFTFVHRDKYGCGSCSLPSGIDEATFRNALQGIPALLGIKDGQSYLKITDQVNHKGSCYRNDFLMEFQHDGKYLVPLGSNHGEIYKINIEIDGKKHWSPYEYLKKDRFLLDWLKVNQNQILLRISFQFIDLHCGDLPKLVSKVIEEVVSSRIVIYLSDNLYREMPIFMETKDVFHIFNGNDQLKSSFSLVEKNVSFKDKIDNYISSQESNTKTNVQSTPFEHVDSEFFDLLTDQINFQVITGLEKEIVMVLVKVDPTSLQVFLMNSSDCFNSFLESIIVDKKVFLHTYQSTYESIANIICGYRDSLSNDPVLELTTLFETLS